MDKQPKPLGRPPVSKDEGHSVVIRARVGAERAAKFHRLGGAEWLRKAIDKAKAPSLPLDPLYQGETQ
jgi:hypothetical protein